jgi:MFS transporter, ACS family, hexuronate transporter
MSQTKEKIGNYRWYLSTLLFIATTIYYYDRQIFTYAINSDNKDYAKLLGFLNSKGIVDNVLFGYIDTAHKIAYALGFLIMGRFIDKVGLKKGFAVGMTVWSLAAISMAFLHSFWPLFVGMLFLGFFQASDHPASVKTVSEWFPAKDKSMAVGYYNSGTNFGAMIVSILVPVICVAISWQMAYILPGIVGLIWVIFWWYSYNPPQICKHAKPSEIAYINEGIVPVEEAKMSWGKMFTYKEVWGFGIAKFLIDPVWFIYLTWLPKIFKESYGIDFKKLFIPIMLIYSLSLVGNFVGGGLSSYFLRKGWTINKSRKFAMLLFALLAVPSFVSAFISNVWIVIAIVGCVTFAHQAFSTLLYTTVADVFPKNVVGSVTGLGSMLGAVGGIIAAAAAGFITVKFGYAPLFFLGSAAYLLGLGFLHFMNPKLKKVEV